MRKSLLAFAILLFLACAFNASALTGNIIPGGISPSSDKIVVSPGETKTARISFIVLSDKQQTINLIPVNVAFGTHGEMLFPEKPANPVAGFIRKIEPVQAQGMGSTESVEITVTVPKDTAPGDYPAAILAKELNVYSILLIRVPQTGKIKIKGEVKNAKIEVDWAKRIALSAEYENQSDFTIMPGVRCSITKKGGKEQVLDIGLEMFNPRYRFILPGNTRLFTVAIQQPLNVGTYEAHFYSVTASASAEGKPTIIQHLVKELNVDKDLFRNQQATFFIKVPMIVHQYRIPPDFFFNNAIEVVNISDHKVTVRAISAESWLNVSAAALAGIEIEPRQSGFVVFSIDTPPVFAEMLKSNIVIAPYIGLTPAGTPIAVTISVVPGKAK